MSTATVDRDLILVVDDDNAVRGILEKSLRRLGYEVCEAADGEEGLRLAMERRPGVIFTDIRMPGLDGHTLVRRVTSSEYTPAIVVMSGQGEMEDVIDVLRLGAVDYLKKPWSIADVATAAARAMKRYDQPARAQESTSAVASAPASSNTRATNVPPPAAYSTATPATTTKPVEARPATPVVPRQAAPRSGNASGPLDPSFAALLDRVRSGEILVPAVPAVVTELRAVFRKPDAEIEEIVALVERDQRLAAQLLHMSNTVQYARNGRCSDLKTAVGRVGLRQTENLVEALFAHGCYKVKDPVAAEVQSQIWKFSVARAVSMRAVAVLARRVVDPEFAYLAGLLSDIGGAFLLWLVTERAASTMSFAPSATEEYLPFIRSFHGDVGAMVLERWGASPLVISLSKTHHQVSPPLGAKTLWQIETLGNYLAQRLLPQGDVTMTTDRDPAVRATAMKALQINAGALDRLETQLEVELVDVLAALT